MGLVLASRAVKERKTGLYRPTALRYYGRFKLSVSNVISNAAVIESLLMKPSELPGTRNVYRLTNPWPKSKNFGNMPARMSLLRTLSSRLKLRP